LAATKALRLEKAQTKREKDYLSAIEILFSNGDVDQRLRAYRSAMKNLHETYVDDDEAAVFYALAILGAQRGTRNFAEYMKAAATAERVFAKNPLHPGAAHMLIHSYDDPIHAPLGLRAAEAYSEIAPAASHALHMPSHIFVALGMWDRVVDLNERSWKAAENRRVRKGLGKRARSFHAISWLSYAYLQQGRFQDSSELIKSVSEDIAEDGTNGMKGYYIAMKAAYVVNSEQWDTEFLESDKEISDLSERAQVVSAFTTGFAAIKMGDRTAAEKSLEDIRNLRSAEEEGGVNQYADIMSSELKALILADSGNLSQAIDLATQAAEMESEMAFAFGPPSIVKPTHELLGELLLADGRYDMAISAFEEALARAPRRALSLRGHALAAAGARDVQTAEASYGMFKNVRALADTEVKNLEEATKQIDE
jgi:tetratricopeptide (TPR) repeat protein